MTTIAQHPISPLRDIDARARQLFDKKHNGLAEAGWNPRLRHRFGYLSPDDYYETVVESLVERGADWLDVGGGSSVFPSNPGLASELGGRCRRLTVVDPSPNVDENPFAHERHRVHLEELEIDSRHFTLATARMVAEHVADPERFVAKLGQLVTPRGKVVIYTVSRWAPMTLLSAFTPMRIHHYAKKKLWGTEENDTFAVTYRMNTRARLRVLFQGSGFREVAFYRLDDCRTLARWKVTLTFELVLWKLLRWIGIGYPESCLIGVYEKGC